MVSDSSHPLIGLVEPYDRARIAAARILRRAQDERRRALETVSTYFVNNHQAGGARKEFRNSLLSPAILPFPVSRSDLLRMAQRRD